MLSIAIDRPSRTMPPALLVGANSSSQALNKRKKLILCRRALAQAVYLVSGVRGRGRGRKKRTLIDGSSVTIPFLIIASVNAKVLWDEHWAHWEHMEPLEERVEYPYQNIRTKNYFWGDGDKVSFNAPSDV